MAEARSGFALVAAILANAAIAVTKFAAAFVTRSSAMLSEGIHSVVDMGNGGLLLFGVRQSRRPPDREHPFGHGKDLYFWTLIVAVSVFALGGGASTYEGITHILHPEPLTNATWNYLVIGAAAVFEGWSQYVALREFRQARGGRGTLDAIRHGKDPSLFLVLIENSAALAGLAVAFVGVLLGHVLNNPYIDGAASIVIGLILMTAAIYLMSDARGLLIGESGDPEMVAHIARLATGDDDVTDVGEVLTMYLGPHDALLNLDVVFRPDLTAEEMRAAIDRIERDVSAAYPEVTRIYVEAAAFAGSGRRHRETRT